MLKILITTELIMFSFHPVMVFGYFIFILKSLDGFKLFYNPFLTLLVQIPLDARRAAAGKGIRQWMEIDDKQNYNNYRLTLEPTNQNAIKVINNNVVINFEHNRTL